MNRDNSYKAENVLCTRGALEAIYAVLKGIFKNRGETILIPRPAYPELRDKAAMFGNVELLDPEFLLDYKLEDRFVDEIARRLHFNRSIRAILLTSPNNPTSMDITVDKLYQIIEIAKRKGVWVIVDESNDNFNYKYGGYVRSVPHNIDAENVIRVRTLAKEMAVGGAREERMGFVLANEDIIRNLGILYEQMFGCPSTLFVPMLLIYFEIMKYYNRDYGIRLGKIKDRKLKKIAKALEEWDYERNAEMAHLRDIVASELCYEFGEDRKIRRGFGVVVDPGDAPGGSFNAFIEFNFKGTGFELFKILLERGVATIPGGMLWS